MSNYLATIGDVSTLAENLQAARQEVGSGSGGDTYIRVDDRTGEVTFGQEKMPLSPDHRFVVGLHEMCHGYLVSTPPPAKVLERHVIPMAQGGTRPTPPGGQYGTYEQGGARDVVEIRLSSIDEPGFRPMFTAWGGGYNTSRVGDLMDEAIAHLGSADGQAGFIHPVVTVSSASDNNKKWARVIHFIKFTVGDWLHRDGQVLLSARASSSIGVDATKKEFEARAASERALWDDDEELTGTEQEVFGAA